MHAFVRTLHRFRRDTSGNIAVIFMLTLLPLLSAVGCAVDYSAANAIRSKLQSAADAATVGSVSRTAPGFIAAGAMTGDGPIPVGVSDATKLFEITTVGKVPGRLIIGPRLARNPRLPRSFPGFAVVRAQ